MQSKIRKRSWILHECLERVSSNIDTTKYLIDFGLRGTDLESLIAIKENDDHALINYKDVAALSNREKEFLKLACSELSYKEIADKMHLSSHTIDGYRDALFAKLKLKSRIGLVLFAIRSKIVFIE